MYLNERSWEIQQDDPYTISKGLKEFLKIYAILSKDYGIQELYVPAEEEPFLRSQTYSIAKWLSEVDLEYRRLFLGMWQKRIVYNQDEECEVTYDDVVLKGGTEAALNQSFLISICFTQKWMLDEIHANLYSVTKDLDTPVIIPNIFRHPQLRDEKTKNIVKNTCKIEVRSYEDLWEKREKLFPNLCFCPSVKKDLDEMENTWLYQIIRKLDELNRYKAENPGIRFWPEQLKKATPESEITLKTYKQQHTFCDAGGKQYLASWHVRFTGIPGRIFFIPDYAENSMLICYIGKKLPNVTYPK